MNEEIRMPNGELPDGWLRAPFSSVTVNPVQRVPIEKEQIIYIDIGSVDRITKQVVEPQTMLGKDAPSRARKVVQTGDVLVSTVRPNLNAVALVESQYNGQFASTGFDVLRSPVVDPRWLFYSVRTPEFLDRMSELVQGALYPAVRSFDIRSFVIPLAPLAEQKRIADKLEAVLGRVDACRARLDRVPALLKRFRQSVLAAATSGKLTEEWRESEQLPISAAKDLLEQTITHRQETWQKSAKGAAGRKYVEPEDMDSNDLPEIPESWLWASADSVSSQVTDGEHIQPPYQSVGFPMLSAKHVRDGFVDSECAGLIAKVAFDKALKRCAPQNGDLLIVSVGATTGRVAIVENCEPFAIVRSVLLVKPLIPNRYFLRCLQSPWCFQRMTKASGASAQAHLYIKDTKRLPIPIPPLPEQQEIVRRVENLFAFADRIEARLATAQKTVERLTPATLAKAFRGELASQDPNDEPASALLARLQNQPAAKPAKATRQTRK